MIIVCVCSLLDRQARMLGERANKLVADFTCVRAHNVRPSVWFASASPCAESRFLPLLLLLLLLLV